MIIPPIVTTTTTIATTITTLERRRLPHPPRKQLGHAPELPQPLHHYLRHDRRPQPRLLDRVRADGDGGRGLVQRQFCHRAGRYR
jgi:hypothetical protein